MSAPLGVAVVGCGRVANLWHVPAVAEVHDVTLAGLADLDAQRASDLSRRAGGVRWTDDYRELLVDPGVDVVAVATPAASHAEITVAALEAGKHVLVEKPLALTLDDCERIVEAAAKAPGKAAVGFNQRELRHARRARDIRRSGALGEVKLLRTVYTSESRFRTDDPPWRWSRESGGGVLIEAAIHHLDLWEFLLDEEVEEVLARSASGDESAAVSARTSRGTLIGGDFCEATAPTNELDLFGSAARLRVSCLRFDGLDLQPREEVPGAPSARLRRAARLPGHLPAGLRELRSGGSFAATYRRQWRRLAGALREDLPVECPVDAGLRAVRTLLAVLESTATGQAVTVAEAAREPVALPSPAAAASPAVGMRP